MILACRWSPHYHRLAIAESGQLPCAPRQVSNSCRSVRTARAWSLVVACEHSSTEFVAVPSAGHEPTPELVAGRYVLLEKIGEGGMGEVWLALQTEPVKRKVALKLIKKGMDSRAVLARFEQERQALAVMDHPSI